MTNVMDNPGMEKKNLYMEVLAQLVKLAYGLQTLSMLTLFL